jgi:hypothetical protein
MKGMQKRPTAAAVPFTMLGLNLKFMRDIVKIVPAQIRLMVKPGIITDAKA